jgi:hypothetical protein
VALLSEKDIPTYYALEAYISLKRVAYALFGYFS